MKRQDLLIRRVVLALLLTLGAASCVNRAGAQANVYLNATIQSPVDFYGPLAPYGAWVDVPPYGRCWRPMEVPPDWRPYTNGYWEWTDAGWYWMSDEPWAWACYHYGQWVLDPVYGWVWLPGTEWAPAWVTWREAPDYIGWAPCGPSGVVYGTTPFFFVDVHHFHDHLRPRELVYNDRRILTRSRVVGGFRTETKDWDGVRRRIAVNRGPDVTPIERATGTRLVQRPVREVVRQTPRPAVGSAQGAFTQQPISPNRNRAGESDERGRGNASRLYREPQVPQSAPTGRQEQRLYREAPTAQPTVPSSGRYETTPRVTQPVTPPQSNLRFTPAPAPTQTEGAPINPQSMGHRERPNPAPVVTPPQRPLPPTGFEHGRRPVEVPQAPAQVPRNPEPAPVAPQPSRVVPTAPAVPVQPAIPSERRDEGHKRDRDGQ